MCLHGLVFNLLGCPSADTLLVVYVFEGMVVDTNLVADLPGDMGVDMLGNRLVVMYLVAALLASTVTDTLFVDMLVDRLGETAVKMYSGTGKLEDMAVEFTLGTDMGDD